MVICLKIWVDLHVLCLMLELMILVGNQCSSSQLFVMKVMCDILWKILMKYMATIIVMLIQIGCGRFLQNITNILSDKIMHVKNYWSNYCDAHKLFT